MARDWESTFSDWKGPASNAEESKYELAVNKIKRTLESSSRLSSRGFRVFAKGSYPNFTNVRRDSDVDIAVELTDYNINDFVHEAKGLSIGDVGLPPYADTYEIDDFKADVHWVLQNEFGANRVKRGDKAIRISEAAFGIPADVVPCVTLYTWFSQTRKENGIRLRSDRSPLAKIDNYPSQHLRRGVNKNAMCSKRYKSVVRILKRLENEMAAKQIIDEVPSFLIESAVWNVPNDKFLGYSWTGRLQSTLAHIFNETRDASCVCSEDWLEANGINFLFHSTQSWDFGDAHQFASAAWDYIGFE